ncbi:MAG: hypothetical protein LWW93_01750 [Hyphomicrobiales bacterium]|nr:hypothetical protein [Hyphomicrobiales bacterium]
MSEPASARPIAPCAAVFAVAEETAARARLAAFAERFGLDVVRAGWEPYRKLGAHSRVWFWWRLPQAGEAAAVAALDRLAVAVAGEAASAEIDRRFERSEESGSVRLEIVLAKARGEILEPDLLWLDLEVDLEPEVQADLAAALTS